jgi:3'-5' exoribonuclease
MTAKPFPVVALCDLVEGQEADLFALLVHKDDAKTRDGKPYWRVTFRDARRDVTFPIWNDSPLANACRDEWQAGQFYKLRATYKETEFGPKLDIRRIRPTCDDDRADGFDPLALLPKSRFDPLAMFAELLEIARSNIACQPLVALVQAILTQHRELLCDLPAAAHHHHAFRSGFLEHVLSVTKNALFLAEKYSTLYPEVLPSSSRDLVIAGAILHDIGKLLELRITPAGARYTPQGELIGHVVLGRDVVRQAAEQHPLDPEMLLRLEHIIVSHQKTPEWGSPKPPMTPEALLVHYADDIDAKLQMMVEALQADVGDRFMTSRKNLFNHKLFKHLPDDKL